MTEYSLEEKRHAREVLGIRRDKNIIPLLERSKEALIDTIIMQRENHTDALAAANGANEALRSRLRSHRKAKALANKRADAAVAAMRYMLDRFEDGDSQ